MGKVNYLLLDMSVLPEVYVKVIEAKGYLQSGETANASQAGKMAGISCSASVPSVNVLQRLFLNYSPAFSHVLLFNSTAIAFPLRLTSLSFLLHIKYEKHKVTPKNYFT